MKTKYQIICTNGREFYGQEFAVFDDKQIAIDSIPALKRSSEIYEDLDFEVVEIADNDDALRD